MGTPRVVYVLTCSEESLYIRSTMLSIQLLRRVEPEAEVILLTDSLSKVVLDASPTKILELVDQCQVVPLSEPNCVVRSRELKVRMRSLVAGDFVFLDSDVLPLRPFGDAFQQPFEVAAVLDRNHIQPFPHFPRWFEEDFAALGWAYPTAHYYNSGVLFFRDLPATRAFARVWEDSWRDQYSRRGKHYDQPAFNHAVDDCKLRVLTLDISYNALVRASPWFGREARLLHFHADQHSHKLGSGDLLGHLLRFWDTHRALDWEAVEKARRSPYSWLEPPEHLSFLFLTGYFGLALKLLARKLRQALARPAMLRDFLKDKLIRRNSAR